MVIINFFYSTESVNGTPQQVSQPAATEAKPIQQDKTAEEVQKVHDDRFKYTFQPGVTAMTCLKAIIAGLCPLYTGYDISQNSDARKRLQITRSRVRWVSCALWLPAIVVLSTFSLTLQNNTNLVIPKEVQIHGQVNPYHAGQMDCPNGTSPVVIGGFSKEGIPEKNDRFFVFNCFPNADEGKIVSTFGENEIDKNQKMKLGFLYKIDNMNIGPRMVNATIRPGSITLMETNRKIYVDINGTVVTTENMATSMDTSVIPYATKTDIFKWFNFTFGTRLAQEVPTKFKQSYRHLFESEKTIRKERKHNEIHKRKFLRQGLNKQLNKTNKYNNKNNNNRNKN